MMDSVVLNIINVLEMMLSSSQMERVKQGNIKSSLIYPLKLNNFLESSPF